MLFRSGCSFIEKKEIVRCAFKKHFVNADIYVESDLLGACRALFGNSRGVACILGTGSNSCLYDGEKIVKNISPLGFILGDEGSGAVLGKNLVADCLKNQLPTKLIEKFYTRFKTTHVEVMENVYKKSFPNRYLASLTPFLSENIKEKEIRTLVKSNFESFFERNISQYKLTTESVSFVGSIAYYFEDILQEVAKAKGLTIALVDRKPIERLLKYHIENMI